MARIEVVTITCDGPCGGTQVTSSNVIRIQPEGRNGKTVDLCDDCVQGVLALYAAGTVVAAAPARRGRPPKAAAVKATVVTEPVPVVSPAPAQYRDVPVGEGAPHVAPEVTITETLTDDLPARSGSTGLIVTDPTSITYNEGSRDPNE